jgi:hypothetical protein
MAIPKYLCWLARNRTIFNQELLILEQVAIGPKILLAEHPIAKGIHLTVPQALGRDEAIRFEQFNISFSHSSTRAKENYYKSCWQLRLNQLDFRKWRNDQNSYTLFSMGFQKEILGW